MLPLTNTIKTYLCLGEQRGCQEAGHQHNGAWVTGPHLFMDHRVGGNGSPCLEAVGRKEEGLDIDTYKFGFVIAGQFEFKTKKYKCRQIIVLVEFS